MERHTHSWQWSFSVLEMINLDEKEGQGERGRERVMERETHRALDMEGESIHLSKSL